MRNRSGRDSNRRSEGSRPGGGPRRMPNKLFVGNLYRGTTKVDIEQEFGRFGRLADVWVSHAPPGFAFVEFHRQRDASDCVQALDGRAVLSAKLRVEFAKAEPTDRPVRRKKNVASTSRRSRSPVGGSVGSHARLLPPPKVNTISIVGLHRSPSPLLLLRRGGTSYETVGTFSGLGSSSLVPVRRSRSPHLRSPPPPPVLALPPSSSSRHDPLLLSGRLLAPPPPSAAALFALASGYESLPQDYISGYSKKYGTQARSPPRLPRSPVRGRSRSPVLRRSVSPMRPVVSRSRSRSPVPRRTKLLGRTPPLPGPPSPRQYSCSHTVSGERRSRNHEISMSTAYSRSGVPAAYSSPSPPPTLPPRVSGTTYGSGQYRSPVQRWSRSVSRSYSSERCSRPRGHPSTPPAAYRLPGSLQQSVSRSRSSSSSQASRNRRSRSNSYQPPQQQQRQHSRSPSNGYQTSQRYSKTEQSYHSSRTTKLSPAPAAKWMASAGQQRRSPSPDSHNGRMRLAAGRRH